MENDRTRKRVRRRRIAKVAAISVWGAIVSLFFLWQTVTYRGLVAVLGEWQFDLIGRYFPAITYMLLVLLLVVPGFLLFRRKRYVDYPDRLARAALRSADRFLYFLAAVGGALAIGALAAVIAIWWLPTRSGPLQSIDLREPLTAAPREGPTILKGAIVYDRTAAFDEHLFFVIHNARYAPIVAPGSASGDYQYFVELPAAETPALRPARSEMTGILREGGLPGEIVRLYRYAGARVETPYYVLFADDAAVRWPFVQVAVQIGVVAVFVLLAAVWQWRRRRRLRRQAEATLVDRGLTA